MVTLYLNHSEWHLAVDTDTFAELHSVFTVDYSDVVVLWICLGSHISTDNGRGEEIISSGSPKLIYSLLVGDICLEATAFRQFLPVGCTLMSPSAAEVKLGLLVEHVVSTNSKDWRGWLTNVHIKVPTLNRK